MVATLSVIPLALSLLAGLDSVQATPRFEEEILRFEATDKVAPPAPGSVLFVGSSSIRLWTTLKTDIPDYPTLNRGFGGSWLADSTRLVDRIVLPYKPRAVVLFAGTNDLADGRSPETVAGDYREFVARIREKMPRVPIAYIAISPAPSRFALIDKIKRTNALIRAESAKTPGVRFIDTVPRMLNADGSPRPELFGHDQLHMNAQGYAIWKEIVGGALREMLPAKRSFRRF